LHDGRYRTAPALLLLLSVGCAGTAPRVPPSGPKTKSPVTQEGLATFYASSFHGERSASGETYDQRELVAAHPSFPFGTIVRVTNLENSRTVTVRIIDRGPSRGSQRAGTIIDLSREAGRRLGMLEDGRVRVRLEIVRQPSL
jgi:rare lipoprotein A